MDSIRIKNLRSIVDSGEIELSRINILLGRNSSGKSSFLRLFPLLKETSRHELRGPILWFDENYDFGDFSNTLSRHAEGDKDMITMEFTWKQTNMWNRWYNPLAEYDETDHRKKKNIKVEIGISKHEDKNFFKKIHIVTDDNDILFENTAPNEHIKLTLNGRETNGGIYKWRYGSRGILPQLSVESGISPKEIINASLRKIYDDKSISFDDFYIVSRLAALTDDAIWKLISEHLTKRKGKKAVKNFKQTDDYKNVIDTIAWIYLARYVSYIDEELSDYFNHTYYVTPLRYNFLRYMRNRDLAVEYVESTGKNVMEYILSLNEDERDSYIDYIGRTLEIRIDVEGDENKSICVTMKDGEHDNIVDVGYGYSQVLPIATILWDRAYRKDTRNNEDTIVIEQPEVHLHPAMQKRLARLFVEALNLAKTRSKKLTLIVETHSSTLVNHLGKYVQNNNAPAIPELLEYYQLDEESGVKIDNEDISVYLFDKQNGVSHIAKTAYDKSGRIVRWPIGFLD